MKSARRNLASVVAPVAPWTLAALLLGACGGPTADQATATGEAIEAAAAGPSIGEPGGRLVVALRAEPRTLNPVLPLQNPAITVVRRLTADLLHINRATQEVEAGLAESWQVSDDGRVYRLQLRRDVRFSDGEPFDADDVLFSFEVYLDEEIGYPGRALLVVDGEPIVVRKIDAYSVEFELKSPYAAGERLFDSVAMLPRHLMEEAYRAGRLAELWSLSTPPEQIAGLGPFRFKSWQAGQRLTLERNPHYWRRDAAGNPLPYLDELVFLFVPSEDAQVIRFQEGETDLISRLSAENFAALEGLERQDLDLRDLGPDLTLTFLFFNLNDLAGRGLPEVGARQSWFRMPEFRRAVSAAIDRQGIVELVYEGRGEALSGHVSSGYRRWRNADLPPPVRSVEDARRLLSESGFAWREDGRLLDPEGREVSFTLMTNASNAQRSEILTIVQADLAEIGIDLKTVTLDFQAMVDRIFNSFDYDACVLGFGGGDADPNPMMSLLLSSGNAHFWRLGGGEPASEWESEIDLLMQRQLVEMDPAERKRLYDRVQALVAENLPVIPLASPHILVGANAAVGNFNPAILHHQTLWNAEELYLDPANR